ncbi:MAG: hypothetical protein QGG40_07945 [Myxococcota bacterium]|nr:hypothetical protein [Myxococcota bacterium]
MLWLFLSCTLGDGGPATTGSISAREAGTVGLIAEQASELEALAKELEAACEQARNVEAAGLDQQTEIEKMRALVTRIEELNAPIQEQVRELEERVRAAGSSGEAPAVVEPVEGSPE